MIDKKFNPEKMQKLNNPQRLKEISPDYIWSKLNLKKADVLVDLGAGTGFFSIAFLKLANSSKIYACDISNVMLDWMKQNIVSEYPEINPVKSEEDSIPLDNGIADLVFMINLYHELDNPEGSVKEAYRILRPGGKIFIADWRKEKMDDGPPIEIRYTPEKVRDHLGQAGFNKINIFNELPKHFLVIGEKSND
jgi:ubiquinone/menaquinone biosynthesis C-methylase UbiE